MPRHARWGWARMYCQYHSIRVGTPEEAEEALEELAGAPGAR